MEPLAIAGTIVASLASGILLSRWIRADKHHSDMIRLEEIIKGRDELRALENRAVEHRLNAIEHRQRQLGRYYHNLRGLVIRCLERLGMKFREPNMRDEEEGEDGP